MLRERVHLEFKKSSLEHKTLKLCLLMAKTFELEAPVHVPIANYEEDIGSSIKNDLPASLLELFK